MIYKMSFSNGTNKQYQLMPVDHVAFFVILNLISKQRPATNASHVETVSKVEAYWNFKFTWKLPLILRKTEQKSGYKHIMQE